MSEKTFGNRLKEARKSAGLTQKQLADQIGAKHNSISDWENDKNRPDPDTIELICGSLSISPNYLLGNVEESVSPIEMALIRKYRFLSEHGKEMVNSILNLEYEYEQLMVNQQHKTEIKSIKEEYKEPLELYTKRIRHGGTANNAPPIPKKDYRMVEINQFEGAYGAGAGQYNDNAEMVTIEVPEDELPEGADTTMHVAGDSMEPTISNGDTVYIQHTNTLNIGDIGVFYLDGECFIKEYANDELVSHNPEYAPIQISEFSTFVIQGKVLGKKLEGFVKL